MEKLNILKDINNPLLNRREVQLLIKAEISPKISEAQEFVAKEFSGVAENIKILKIKGNFGSEKFLITANIYNSPEEKNKTESKTKKEKKSKGAVK